MLRYLSICILFLISSTTFAEETKNIKKNQIREPLSRTPETDTYGTPLNAYQDYEWELTKNNINSALKSNILLDAFTALNIGAEITIGSRWSVHGEFLFPWWVDKKHNSFALQVLCGGLEGRYWLGNRRSKRKLTGHFIGAYINGGEYDIQLKRDCGNQGDFIVGGISYGYAFPIISENFSLELSLGIGYLYTKYKSYDIVECRTKLAYQHHGRYQWLGPTKASVSLVWTLPWKIKTSSR